ncbi:MAG: zf-HC2 domain-containing protein [Acidobacteria bacterium]|nr:zf-HC2 domain-containing protein [Acidobacteriota bacterium]
MQCSEFRELSEAYLSDELLVETNLQVYRHMESCPKCREDFAARRVLRSRMRDAVAASPEFAIQPAFETRMNAQLREEAFKGRGWTSVFTSAKMLVPAFALVLVTVFGGIVGLRLLESSPLAADPSLTTFLAETSAKAVGSHDHCALKKMALWDSKELPIEETAGQTAKAVAEPIRANFASDVEILHSHDCLFEGKRFSHVIVRRSGHVLSVFFDREGKVSGLGSAGGHIVSEREKGMQVASFIAPVGAVFVVSDLSEAENLDTARVLSDAFRNRSPV